MWSHGGTTAAQTPEAVLLVLAFRPETEPSVYFLSGTREYF